MAEFVASSDFDVPVESLFEYHARPGALDRLLPPWQNVTVAQRGSSIDVGTEVVLRLGSPVGIPFYWHARHTKLEPPRLFEDIQTTGPVKSWTHQHRFDSLAVDRSRLTDSIAYQLPGGSIGELLGGRYFANELARMFRYRHETTRDDVNLIHRHPHRPLRIALSGANGLVGSNLMALLQVAGHKVIKLTRPDPRQTHRPPSPTSIESLAWSPTKGLENPAAAEGLDAVIHLAGKGIGDHRWNNQVKNDIRNSRVAATEILARQLSELDAPPRVFIGCSAIGFFGDRGDEILDETSSKGSGFLADVCEGWERSADPLSTNGRTRVVHSRLGIVLHPRQGALVKLLTPIRLFVGGKIGSGHQFWSWISIADCIGALYQLLLDDRAEGVFNLVAPQPERNAEFVRKIARILHRPAFLPAPEFAMKILLGEMAGPLLFDSCRVLPVKLEGLGYQFRHKTLESAMRYLLGL